MHKCAGIIAKTISKMPAQNGTTLGRQYHTEIYHFYETTDMQVHMPKVLESNIEGYKMKPLQFHMLINILEEFTQWDSVEKQKQIKRSLVFINSIKSLELMYGFFLGLLYMTDWAQPIVSELPNKKIMQMVLLII